VGGKLRETRVFIGATRIRCNDVKTTRKTEKGGKDRSWTMGLKKEAWKGKKLKVQVERRGKKNKKPGKGNTIT